MNKDSKILDLFRKIICSLLCITRHTKNDALKTKASYYLDYYLEQYELYNNKCIYSLDNLEKIIDFCNQCYEYKDVFDYAEDVEYGVKELNKITIFKEGFKSSKEVY